MKILLLENINEVAKKELESFGHEVEEVAHAPTEEELIPLLKNYDGVGIRSKTKLTEKVLKESSHLSVVGCFCIGVNQVDLKTAHRLGIPVFNAPHANTRSVAELVISEIIALGRGLFDKSSNAHLGKWTKSAVNSFEVRGKTLGIIGYGHIGNQVSILAESLGMNVLFYDVVKKLPLGNARQVPTLKELLSSSDFTTLHVPAAPDTREMMGEREFSYMKEGSYLLNLSRGSVVDIMALKAALESGRLNGAAVDVFPVEPASNNDTFTSPLQGQQNVILTPHIGGSTQEAQVNIGLEVSAAFMKYLDFGSSLGAVNFPNADLPARVNTARITNIHRNRPGVLSRVNTIISDLGINIASQALSTQDELGYLIMDVDVDDAHELYERIKAEENSLNTRLLGPKA